MTKAILLSLLIAVGCSNNKDHQTKGTTGTQKKSSDTTKPVITVVPGPPGSKIYANERFRNVTVQKTAADNYLISGEGQIFEANFGWVVKDGHDEVKSGYQMTNAGAPAWGKFSFTIEVRKKRENSALTLILFETSAKDGSRQHELPITLQ